MRHTDAGLAIPDFPLMFGGLVPDHWDSQIAIHFAHRVGAVVVALSVLAAAARVWAHHKSDAGLTTPAVVLVALVAVQMALGRITVLSGRAVSINSLHVVFGALVLATSLVITLRSWRTRFACAPVMSRLDAPTVHGVGLRADGANQGARA